MHQEYKPGAWLLAIAASLLVGSAHGQSAPSTTAEQTGPGSIPVGPLVVFPGVDFKYGNDSNIFLSNANKRSSNVSILSPYLLVEAKPTPHKFALLMRIDHGQFRSSRDDDYNDYLLDGKGDMVISGRAGLGLHAEYRHGHDPRGSTDRPGGATPDEYDNKGIDGVFRYGAPGAQGRIELEGGRFNREYTNNRANTIVTDRDTTTYGGTFLWRVAPKTEILVQAKRGKIDYELATSTQDSTETRFYAGAKWEATAATSGTVKFGNMKKEFNNRVRQDFSGSSWDAAVTWKPLSYSVVDFVTSKQTNESTGLGDAIITKLYGVTWNHAWNSRFRTQLLANQRQDDFIGGGATRADNTKTYGIGMSYQFRRWLRLGAEFTHAGRDSNNAAFNYDRDQFFFTLGATL